MSTEVVLQNNHGVYTKKKYASDWLVQMAAIAGKMINIYDVLYRLDNPQLYPDFKPKHSYAWYLRYYERLNQLELSLIQHTGFAILGKPVWENLSYAKEIEFGETGRGNELEYESASTRIREFY
ncbi:MAG TPA: hypothetical protein PKA28_17655 [Methylomusa anaerophila]|uniref:Uncharacterized protein n=1 Tax=Methylomusa anaerophila TaxID=1930071 RepID=A0A348AMH3_9FIRM|nr:hypothetical protein [Methylomusa anaerophila]BBB92271.1 hypothetical protein MAMMFC1_02956 [Methylomusa anaerophila]HML90270.1 hypothetical protein [Methylomusa anaerophila]